MRLGDGIVAGIGNDSYNFLWTKHVILLVSKANLRNLCINYVLITLYTNREYLLNIVPM